MKRYEDMTNAEIWNRIYRATLETQPYGIRDMDILERIAENTYRKTLQDMGR